MVTALKIENGQIMVKTHHYPEWHYRRPVTYGEMSMYPDNMSKAKKDWLKAKEFENSLDNLIEDLKYTIPQLKKVYYTSDDILKKGEAGILKAKYSEPTT